MPCQAHLDEVSIDGRGKLGFLLVPFNVCVCMPGLFQGSLSFASKAITRKVIAVKTVSLCRRCFAGSTAQGHNCEQDVAAYQSGLQTARQHADDRLSRYADRALRLPKCSLVYCSFETTGKIPKMPMIKAPFSRAAQTHAST